MIPEKTKGGLKMERPDDFVLRQGGTREILAAFNAEVAE
jgi:hypothetical protein